MFLQTEVNHFERTRLVFQLRNDVKDQLPASFAVSHVEMMVKTNYILFVPRSLTFVSERRSDDEISFDREREREKEEENPVVDTTFIRLIRLVQEFGTRFVFQNEKTERRNSKLCLLFLVNLCNREKMLKISLLPLSLLYKIYYSKQIDSIEFYYLSRALNSITRHIVAYR